MQDAPWTGPGSGAPATRAAQITGFTIPDVIVDLRYSTENNFTNQKIYDFTDVWLRYGTIKKLMLVQEELKQYGCVLKIWDGFRPTSAQFKLWEYCGSITGVATSPITNDFFFRTSECSGYGVGIIASADGDGVTS